MMSLLTFQTSLFEAEIFDEPKYIGFFFREMWPKILLHESSSISILFEVDGRDMGDSAIMVRLFYWFDYVR